MTNLIHYRCSRYLLPTIEATLATNGYTIAIPCQKNSSGASAMVMANCGASVLLGYPAQGELADIEVWGDTYSATTQLLDSLCRVRDSVPIESDAPIT